MRIHHSGRHVPPALGLLLALGLSTVGLRTDAQLYLSNGAVLAGNGQSLICLQNLDLVNNGSLVLAGTLDKLIFSGNADSQLGGDSISTLATLEIAKGSASLILSQDLRILTNIQFDNGLIDLNGHALRLLASGTLEDETNSNRIIGSTGGSVSVSSDSVNAPVQLNLGNLGAVITTQKNLGTLTVTRSQVAATAGSHSGIERTYYIAPSNNSALDATFRFHYLNAELNGKEANSLVLWKSTDGNSWQLVGADSVDATNQFVEKRGIDDFSFWTLSDESNPLPLTLVSFSAVCQTGSDLIRWESGDEQGVEAFILEKSRDGASWSAVDTMAAKSGQGGAGYSYVDPAGSDVAYYRIEIISTGGAVTYSPVFSGGCSDVAMPFAIYPNPATDQAAVRVSVRQAARSQVSLFTTTGQLLGTFEWDLQPGVNATDLPGIARLASGTYTIQLLLHGTKSSVTLIKK